MPFEKDPKIVRITKPILEHVVDWNDNAGYPFTVNTRDQTSNLYTAAVIAAQSVDYAGPIFQILAEVCRNWPEGSKDAMIDVGACILWGIDKAAENNYQPKMLSTNFLIDLTKQVEDQNYTPETALLRLKKHVGQLLDIAPDRVMPNSNRDSAPPPGPNPKH